MTESAFVAGRGDTESRIRAWISDEGIRLAKTATGADVVVSCRPDQLPQRRRRDQVCIAVVADDVPTWPGALRRAAVDAIVPADAAALQRFPSVPFDPTSLDDSYRALLGAVRLKPTIAVGTSVRFVRSAELWGDTHFARDVCDGLRRLGWRTEVQTYLALQKSKNRSNDVLLFLRGLRQCPHVDTPSALWIISHPSRVTHTELGQSDLVYAAGNRAAEKFNARSLLQATNPHRFLPNPTKSELAGRVLFVGNGRGRSRISVDHALAEGLPLSLIGPGWKRVHPELLLTGFVPNDELHHYYSAAGVVLNDHWPDMAELGMISNRLFDVVASGGTVVSDQVHGLVEVFGAAVPSYLNQSDLGQLVRGLLEEPHTPTQRLQWRQAVLAEHSFDHRCKRIDVELRELLSDRA